MHSAEQITKSAKSNLAFALACLPRKVRKDMILFYAYCRLIDDIADEPSMPKEQKQEHLSQWKNLFHSSSPTPADYEQLQSALIALKNELGISKTYFLEIIEGCESDIDPARRFQTWEELSSYTYCVACAVGLISVRIFGCQGKQADDYALALGHALQLTNILRDVGEDIDDHTRVYLPLEDLRAHGYSEEALVRKEYSESFVRAMQHIAGRAESYYEEALNLYRGMPRAERKALRASQAMWRIYRRILKKMQADGFQVFTQRYRMSKLAKAWQLLLANFLWMR